MELFLQLLVSAGLLLTLRYVLRAAFIADGKERDRLRALKADQVESIERLERFANGVEE